MEHVIDEIMRWRLGDPVRRDVQMRWAQELRAVDELIVSLREENERLQAELDEATKPKAVRR